MKTAISRKTRYVLFVALGLCALVSTAAAVYMVTRYDFFIVPTASMEPTIGRGDRILVDSWYYDDRPIARFDLVVLRFPEDPSKLYVRRIVGLPGEIVSIDNGVVYIDNQPLDEPHNPPKADRGFPSTAIADGCYFVLGDNRNASFDSRFWSTPFIAAADILGRASSQ